MYNMTTSLRKPKGRIQISKKYSHYLWIFLSPKLENLRDILKQAIKLEYK